MAMLLRTVDTGGWPGVKRSATTDGERGPEPSVVPLFWPVVPAGENELLVDEPQPLGAGGCGCDLAALLRLYTARAVYQTPTRPDEGSRGLHEGELVPAGEYSLEVTLAMVGDVPDYVVYKNAKVTLT